MRAQVTVAASAVASNSITLACSSRVTLVERCNASRYASPKVIGLRAKTKFTRASGSRSSGARGGEPSKWPGRGVALMRQNSRALSYHGARSA